MKLSTTAAVLVSSIQIHLVILVNVNSLVQHCFMWWSTENGWLASHILRRIFLKFSRKKTNSAVFCKLWWWHILKFTSVYKVVPMRLKNWWKSFTELFSFLSFVSKWITFFLVPPAVWFSLLQRNVGLLLHKSIGGIFVCFLVPMSVLLSFFLLLLTFRILLKN